MKRLLTLALAMLTALPVMAQSNAAPASVRVVPVPENDLSVRIWTDREEYRVGESIRINYRASRDAYVLVFSTDASGETRQLLPNSYDSENFVRGGRTYSIPNSGYRLEVTPPKGRETLSIVAFRERNRAMEAYRTRKSEAFPKSDGARVAIQRIEPRPDSRGKRYAEDSTSIRVIGKSDDNNGGGNYGYGRLQVDSSPSSAYVYLDNQYAGTTPLDMRRVRAGTHDVVINRQGYYPVRKRVRVTEGGRVEVDEDLRPMQYQGWY